MQSCWGRNQTWPCTETYLSSPALCSASSSQINIFSALVQLSSRVFGAATSWPLHFANGCLMSLEQAPEGACLFPLCSFCWGHKLFRVKSKQQLVRYAMNVQSQMHPFRRKAADTWAWIPERHSSLCRGWTAVLFNRCVCMCTCVCMCVCVCM